MTNGSGRRLMDRWSPWIIVILAVAVALSIAANVAAMIANQHRIDDIQTSRVALCALRSDLERRVQTSEKFLKEHPAGIPGIPAKTIRDGIRNQQRTITALAALSCK